MPSKSKAQQKFMGMVHALQKGDIEPSSVSKDVRDTAKSMKKSDAKDFASTPHKGLPKKVKQEILNKLKEYSNKMGRDHLGGDDYTSSKKGGLRDFDGYDNVDYNKDMPMDEGFKSEYEGNDGIIWKKGKSRGGVTNFTPYYKGHNIDFGGHNFKTEKELKDFIKDYILSNQLYRKYRNESNLKGQLAGDSVQDIIKSIGSRFVSGEIKNTKRDGKTYLKLTDEKFGSGVVKILKSRFGIDAKVDYYGGKGKIVSTPSVSFYSDTMLEGKLPNNWMSGRTSDYHTKLRGKKREYDDTNFEKDNSGQPDLEEAQAVSGGKVHKFITGKNLTLKGKKYSDIEFEVVKIDNSSQLVKLKVLAPKQLFGQEMNVPFKTIRRGPFIKTNVNEGELEDTIYQVKKFEKPKDEKLLTIKVINKLKDKRNKSKSSSNKQKLQMMIDKIESEYKKGKYLKEFGSKLTEPFLLPKDEDKLDGTPPSTDAINRDLNETMIRRAVDIAQELLPKDTWSRHASDGKKNAEFVKNVVRDLTQSLNRFYKNHNINVRIKEEEGDSNVDMVLGVLSILRQIEDKENRKKVAVDMIKKFKEQNIDFDYQEFLDLMKEYSMGSYEYNK